jgi:hypothetical protein
MKEARKGMSELEAAKLGGEVNKRKKEERVKEYNKNPSKCKKCDNSICYEKRGNQFCSKSCSASHNNLGVRRHGSCAKNKCNNCENLTKNKYFCSTNCQKEDTRKKNRIMFKANGEIRSRKDTWYLEESRGRKCEDCNNSEWRGKEIPLDLHHIDGNSDNNRLDNLQLLCPNCHRSTDNHGSKNKVGRSRRKEYRKARYDKGLSY